MRKKNLGKAVGASSYPGRGIVVGKTQDGRKAFFAYFIMGRSANSRNRIFAEYGDEVRTEAFDETKVEDPSLIIYSPVKVVGSEIIVTNGDQTDTIEEYLKKGVCFRRGLQTRSFEPDAPNFTPRISAVLHLGKRVKDYSYELSVLKCEDGKGKKCSRHFYLYEPENGTGHFLHTYKKDGNPLPSFEGEPERVKIGNDAEAIAAEIWNNLDPENKISLVCRTANLKTGETKSVIYNVHDIGKRVRATDKQAR